MFWFGVGVCIYAILLFTFVLWRELKEGCDYEEYTLTISAAFMFMLGLHSIYASGGC